VTFLAPEQLDLRPDPQAHKERKVGVGWDWLDGWMMLDDVGVAQF